MWGFRRHQNNYVFLDAARMFNQEIDIINKHQKELEEAARKLMESKIEEEKNKWLVGS
jgi:adenylate kinase